MAEPYLADSDFVLYNGDALDVLRELPSESADCVITSPPYWGLRDYSTEGQLGLEPAPEQYVTRMVEVFREVRRVLAKHGTCWLNMGDSYATNPGNGRGGGENVEGGIPHYSAMNKLGAVEGPGKPGRVDGPKAGLKPKDLCGIPWRLAFALQADGWVLRSDIIWAKPNPMPESVTDRPTKAHEYIFLLTKAEWRGIENPLRLDRGDAMWLAAMMDGEGSICVNTKKGKEGEQPTYSAALRCYNASREIIERVIGITGVGTIGTTPSSGENGTRVVYRWQCGGRTAVPILDAIEPYLIAKRQQAHLLLELQGMPRHHGPQPGFGKGMKPRPAALTRRQEEIARGCSELNKTGETDVQVFPWKRGYWKPLPYSFDQEAVREPALRVGETIKGDYGERDIDAGVNGGWLRGGTVVSGRNIRSVWEIATQPFPEAHFATFPEELVRRCLLAGCPEQVCGECGEPQTRIIETNNPSKAHYDEETALGYPEHLTKGGNAQSSKSLHRNPGGVYSSAVVVGMTDCGHNAYRPGIVLDPFLGSGTVALVARKHGRRCVGIELNPAYCEMAAKRTQQLGLFSEVA